MEDQYKINSILFDMDGVILNSMPFHVKAWKDAFRERDIEVDEGLFYLYEGAMEPEVACNLFSRNGTELTIKDFFEIHERQKHIFLERYAHRVRPFEGTLELLKWLKEDEVPVGLVTSSHGEILEAVLPGRLRKLFGHIVTGDTVRRRKPHPEPYLAGLRGLGASKDRGNIAVENAPAGIESALNAGLSCIAITTTLSRKHLKDAHRVVRNHNELFEELKGTASRAFGKLRNPLCL